MNAEMGVGRRIGLVGCVKDKEGHTVSARELYRSPLFTGRRAFVERSCTEWWILSALHELVHPDQLLAPYDVTLKNMGSAERRAWSERVLRSLDERVRPSRGDVIEFHAGAEYRDFGLSAGLKARGCSIEIPTAGLGLGKQLQFYKEAGRRFR